MRGTPKIHLLVGAAVLLGAAGCGGSGGGKGATPTTSPPTTARTTTTAPTTTSVPPTTVAPPSTAAPTTAPATSAPTTAPTPTPLERAACQPGQITITTPGDVGTLGTGDYTFVIVNRSGTTCQIGGYFGASVYDVAGRLVSVAERSPIGTGAKAIPLRPGGVASFLLTMAENTTTTCPSVGAFHLIPPNATTSVQVDEPTTRPAIDCGSVRVGPTSAGSSPPP